MKCSINIQPLAQEDFKKLSPELRKDVIKQLNKLKKNVYLGPELEDKNGKDLSTCRKIFFGKAAYRIVYRILEDTVYVLNVQPIADIIAIGPRANEKVYEVTNDRLKAEKEEV